MPLQVIEAAPRGAPGILFVAWSYGGHVTMDFLRHHPPERLGGVVFVGRMVRPAVGALYTPGPAAQPPVAKRLKFQGQQGSGTDIAEKLDIPKINNAAWEHYP